MSRSLSYTLVQRSEIYVGKDLGLMDWIESLGNIREGVILDYSHCERLRALLLARHSDAEELIAAIDKYREIRVVIC